MGLRRGRTGLGVALGTTLRWFADSGVKLRELLSRYELLLASMPRFPELRPPALTRALAEVRSAIALGNAAGAEALLKAIEEKAGATLLILDILTGLDGRVGRQGRRVGSADVDPQAKSTLLGVIATERSWIEAMVASAYPVPIPTRPSRPAKRTGPISRTSTASSTPI